MLTLPVYPPPNIIVTPLTTSDFVGIGPNTPLAIFHPAGTTIHAILICILWISDKNSDLNVNPPCIPPLPTDNGVHTSRMFARQKWECKALRRWYATQSSGSTIPTTRHRSQQPHSARQVGAQHITYCMPSVHSLTMRRSPRDACARRSEYNGF